MKDENKTKEQFTKELSKKRLQVVELEKSEIEIKRVEKALQESETKYRLLVDNSYDLIWTLNADGVFTFLSPSWIRTLGYEPSYMIGKPFQSIVHPDEVAICEDYFHKVIQIKEQMPGPEYRVKHADGTWRWHEANGTPVFGPDGSFNSFVGVSRDITEHKQAEEALQQSERRLNDMIDFLPDATLAIDNEKKIIVWNKAIERITGIKAEDMIGKGNYEYTIPFYGKRRPQLMDLIWEPEHSILEKYPHVNREGESLSAETFCGALYDGRGAHVFAKTSPLHDRKGNVVGAIESIRDITEHKQAEEALKASEKLYRSVIENINDSFYRTDAQGNLIMISPSAKKLLGYDSVEEMIGLNIAEAFYFNPEDRNIFLSAIKNQGIVIDYEIILKRRDGTPVTVATSSHQYFDEDGNVLGIEGVLRDFTERKQAEEALRESKQQLSYIIDFLPDATFVIDKEGRIIAWNRAMEEMTGIKASDMLGKSDYEYSLPFYGIRRPLLIDLAFMSGEDIGKNYHSVKKEGDIILAETDSPVKGETRSLWGIARPLYDSEGNIAGAIESIRDITDLKKLQTQIRQTQKMEAIGTLAGGIAHDFNNILSAIMGYTDMALTDHKIDNLLRRYLEQVYKAGERARDLVKQILTFSRQSDEGPRPMRVSPIIKETLKLLRASLPSTIQIRQSIKADPDTVLADPTQIHQILMNLCTNAAHAMRGGDGELKISLSPVELDVRDDLTAHNVLSPGMFLKLTVSDTGVGIAPEVMDRIFEPFFTTKKPGEGTGMGLSVVYGIVKGYSGAVTVDSEVEKGTQFHVYLPLLIEEETERKREETAHIAGGKERILFVDDEENLVQLGTDMLTSIGYEVTGRTSSLEALELFRNRPDSFDLVITDMTMPNMIGTDLAQELMRIRPAIPVILCTGFSELITPDRTKSLGIRDFIMKPIILNQIAASIRHVLDRKE